MDHGNKEINIQLTKNGNEAELVFRNKVTDPGEIDIKRVFERFYKADRARSKKFYRTWAFHIQRLRLENERGDYCGNRGKLVLY